MNEDRLQELLRQVPVPDAAAAERRGLAMVERAFAERQPVGRPVLPRLALALAAVTLLVGLLLSPAGAAVRDWIDDAFTTGVPDAEPALSDLPGGGRLLVQSREGPWVVQPDGSRRLLGSYDGAGWSPHGLFLATTAGRTLNAVEPDGTPRWSISAGGPVRDPRWSPSGYRVAYRSGRELRVVDADGTRDRLVDPAVAAAPPAWFPSDAHLLAYLDDGQRVRLVEPDSGRHMGSAYSPPGTIGLTWAPDGSLLLEWSRHDLWQHTVSSDKLAGGVELSPPQRAHPPLRATIRSAAFSPRGGAIAALVQLPQRAAGKSRSEVFLIDPDDGLRRRLFAVSGQLSGLTWSPDGRYLLVAWPDADQWLFLPVGSKARIKAVEGIATLFAPGSPGPAPFPRVEGWCCSAP
jgi:dipeptidyl aminopeptidase/acylaminoacyl peptidase